MCIEDIPQDASRVTMMYFIRRKEEPVTLPEDEAMLDEAMVRVSGWAPCCMREACDICGVLQTAQREHGVLCGHSLEMLDQAMNEVFVPLLTAPFMKEVKDASLIGGEYVVDSSHNEFIGNMQTFVSQLAHAIQQVNSRCMLFCMDLRD